MAERWYQKAVVYCLDVETFQDSDGDERPCENSAGRCEV
jgi:hypothetical protein